MGFERKIEQYKKEYSMYENISETFKLQDGTMVSISELGKEKGGEVLTAIYKRKEVLKEIIESNGKFTPVREEELQEFMRDSDSYFYSKMYETNLDIDSFFRYADKNRAKTPEFQEYHMLYTALKTGVGMYQSIDSHEYYKRQMHELKAEFEEQKKNRDEVVKKLVKKYGKEGLTNLVENYRKNAYIFEKAEQKMNKCAKARSMGEIHLDNAKNKINELNDKIMNFDDNCAKKDSAVERLKVCIDKYEENKKKGVEQLIQEKLQGPQEALAASQNALDKAKRQLAMLMENVKMKKEKQEYINRMLENYAKEDYYGDNDDKIQEFLGKLTQEEVNDCNKRLEKAKIEQQNYFMQKLRLDSFKEELENEKKDPDIILKYTFTFNKDEDNPLIGVEAKDYLTQANKFIEEIEKGRPNRKQELEGYKKSLADTKAEYTKIDDKLKKIKTLETEAKKTYDAHKKEYKERLSDYVDLVKARDGYRDSYKRAFESPQSLEVVNPIPNIQKTVQGFLDKQNLHAGAHKNSPEFDNMIHAMVDVVQWPKKSDGGMSNKSMEETVANLQNQINKYKIEKDKQIRIFPSALRRTRNAMAKHLGSFLEIAMIELVKSKEDIKELKELNEFFESKGHYSEKPEAEIENKETKDKETKDKETKDEKKKFGEYKDAFEEFKVEEEGLER